MVHVLAISLQDQVEKYGAYVGIAAFFGLAVLMVLTFAQARELKRLREWAGRAPERAQDLEERVMAQAQQARTARAQPAAAPVVIAPKPAAVAATPAAAPAAKGTTVHPAAAAATVPAAATAAGATAPPPSAPVSGNGADQATAAVAPVVPPPPVPVNGTSPREGALPPPPPPPPRAPAAPLRTVPSPARRPAATYGAATAASRSPGAAPRSRRGTALLIGGIVAALAALAFLATQLLGSGGSGSTRPAGTPAASASPAAEADVPIGEARSTATVAVLNGTTSPGLAQSFAERLASEGYPESGKVATGPDQTVATSTVFYAEGQQRLARDAARILDVSEVQPMDADAQALAGENAKLLVIVGSDSAPAP